MSISRSGYYKWLKNSKFVKQYQLDRHNLCDIIKEIHSKWPSYGYRRINATIQRKIGWVVSDNYVHRGCKFLGIKSKVKRYKWSKPKEEHYKYPNIVNNNWKVSRPMEKIVSDMTCLPYKGKLYNLVLYIDVFNNEIISHKLSARNGDVKIYYEGLKDIIEKIKEGQPNKVILHTDQGVIYSSRIFADIHSNYNITHSMSRVGTPTDNPIVESLNGWIKEELSCDFKYHECNDLFKLIDDYVHYYNNERPSFKLKYKTPIQYKHELGF